MRLIGNHLTQLDFTNFPGDAVDSDLNEADADEGFQGPRWQLSFDATWRRGPLSVNYGFTYFSETLRDSNTATRNDPFLFPPEFTRHPRLFTHDAQVRYEIGDQYQVYVGVNNFTDQEPSIGETFFPVSAVGRFVYAGFRADLGGFSDLNPFN
jgi:outer membrane receptor protein involved in Fe transport